MKNNTLRNSIVGIVAGCTLTLTAAVAGISTTVAGAAPALPMVATDTGQTAQAGPASWLCRQMPYLRPICPKR